jgi:hypothetical protein
MRDLTASFYLPSNTALLLRTAILALAVFGAVGCRRHVVPTGDELPSPTAEKVAAALESVPEDAGIILAVDVAALRGRPLWAAVLPVLARHAEHVIDGMTAATGFDPSKRVDRILIALPGEPTQDHRFVLRIDAEALDEAGVGAWLRARLGPDTAVAIRDQRQILIARGAWTSALDTLRESRRLGRSAASDPVLYRLCVRAATNHPVWGAAVLPSELRHRLLHEASFPDVGALSRLTAYVDDQDVVRVGLTGELGNSHDAMPLARRLERFLAQARRQPEMLWRGLSPYLEGVRVVADRADVKATLTVPAPQLEDFVERIEALAQRTRTQ